MHIQADMDSTDEKSAYTPALPALRAQHREMRHRFLGGFDSRRDLLLWAHATTAVTVGRVPAEWFAEMINDRWMVAATLADESRRAELTNSPPDDEQAHSVRMDVVEDTLSPAFQSAVKTMRIHAGDYVEESGGLDHVSRQRHIALRPRLTQLAVSQHKALRWALGSGDWTPPSNRDEALDWADYVGYACAGTLPEDWARRVASPLGEWWGPLLKSRGPMLESLLAAEILPKMRDSLRMAGRDAEEMAEPKPMGNDAGGIS
jgi:hypothetical protein